ncbi:molybdopterin dinucleotide binding domain-containing protein [Ignatzschineria indica]|uniref:molybdopterin dinucleotide binding domain-containing protein n=1 Tax=Ignatzschineria indica TaxID=472583 RepID=UPI0036386125
MSSTSGSTLRLRMIKPTNLSRLVRKMHFASNVQNGDRVRIESPNGAQESQIMVLDGVKPGVLAMSMVMVVVMWGKST